MSVIPAFGSQRYGEQNFKVNISDSKFGAILGYMTPCPPPSKKKKETKAKKEKVHETAKECRKHRGNSIRR